MNGKNQPGHSQNIWKLLQSEYKLTSQEKLISVIQIKLHKPTFTDDSRKKQFSFIKSEITSASIIVILFAKHE